MAILLDIKSGPPFYDTFALNFYGDDDRDRVRRWAAYKEEKRSQNTVKIIRAGHHPFVRSKFALAIPSDMVARRLRLVKGTKLPDYIHESCMGKLVNAKLRDLIVSLEEPGAGYNLHPIEIYTSDDRLYPDQYFIWDVFRKIDAIDPTCDGIKTVAGEPTGNHTWTYAAMGIPRTRDHLAVQAEVIQDFAVWHDYRFYEYYVFVCDALFEKMKGANVTGFSAQSEWTER